MTIVVDVPKIDLAPWGYAPGLTLFYCCDCNNDGPEQGHRHATRCATHALEARMRDIRMLESADMAEVYEPKPCNSNLWLRIIIIGSVIGGGILGGLATNF